MNFDPLSPEALRVLASRLNELADLGEKARKEAGEAGEAGRVRNLSFANWVETNRPRLVAVAKREYRQRRLREDYIDPVLLGEPVWDMLLDLFICTAEGKRVKTTSLQISSSIPPTTSLRYVDLLIKRGIARRSKSLTDQRIVYIEMTEEWYINIAKLIAILDQSLSSSLPGPNESYLINKQRSVSEELSARRNPPE